MRTGGSRFVEMEDWLLGRGACGWLEVAGDDSLWWM